MKLVVGLGNPGSQYEKTRHNIGFRVVDALVEHTGAHRASASSFFGTLYKTPRLLLLKPETYMNASGKSVRAVTHFYKIDLADVIVVHDDIDLPFGALRFKQGGGHGGHNGLKSIDGAIGQAYLRVRFGVGKPLYKSHVADYVLSAFDDDEEVCIPKLTAHTLQAIHALLKHPLAEVQSRFTLKSAKAVCP